MMMEKMIFDFDPSKCTACLACVMACMDQNDIDAAHHQHPFRNAAELESEDGGSQKFSFLSVACMHCEDAPCVMAAPVLVSIKIPKRRLDTLRQHQLHRLPLLRHGLSFWRAFLQCRRKDGKVRRLCGAAAPGYDPRLCAGLPFWCADLPSRKRVSRGADGKIPASPLPADSESSVILSILQGFGRQHF